MALEKDKIRTFLAFPLPADILEVIRDVQQCLIGRDIRISWVKPENIHLTVKFLGEISPASVQLAIQAAETTAVGASPMELSVKGLGVFPDARRPRVIWAGLSGRTQSLIDFQADLEENLANVGFEKERRRFKAHLTLGRVKKKLSPVKLVSAFDACGGFASRSFAADRLVLYRSQLRPEGAVYTALQAFDLAG